MRHHLFVLLLDHPGSGGEHPESGFPLSFFGCNAQLEENIEKVGPGLSCGRVSRVWRIHVCRQGSGDEPLSVYCLATSATASLILFRTAFSVSVASVSRSLVRMTPAWSGLKEMKVSVASDVAVFRVLDAIRRKITAAYSRSLTRWPRQHSVHERATVSAVREDIERKEERYRGVGGAGDLLGQAHQQDFGPSGSPVVLEVLFCLCANIVVTRLQSHKKLRQLGSHVGG